MKSFTVHYLTDDSIHAWRDLSVIARHDHETIGSVPRFDSRFAAVTSFILGLIMKSFTVHYLTDDAIHGWPDLSVTVGRDYETTQCNDLDSIHTLPGLRASYPG